MTRMTVNGEAIHYKLDPATPLLWALRDASNLTGTKYGCDSRDCGACTVIIDGRAALSCGVAIRDLEGATVTTIEGLSDDRSHPVQQAWLAEQVTMCGYCEPGFIMAIAALLEANPAPSDEQITALPNLCRCGAYPRIRKAIARAAATAAATATNSVPQPKQSFSGTSSAEEQQAP
jgi:isoquinoline 1-oxidoreductase alpha subunit